MNMGLELLCEQIEPMTKEQTKQFDGLINLYLQDKEFREFSNVVTTLYCEAVERGLFEEMKGLLYSFSTKFITMCDNQKKVLS